MQIVQIPVNGRIYFLKNIPDTIIQQTGQSTSVTFRLQINLADILTENYTYDENNSIQIRDIAAIVKDYLKDNLNVSDHLYAASTNQYVNIQYAIDDGFSTISGAYYVLKCEYDMVGLNADDWVKYNFLTQRKSGKRTNVKYNEFISFFQKKDMGALSVKVNIQLMDSFTEFLFYTIPVYDPETVFLPHRIITVNTSLQLIMQRLSITDATKVLYYDIWVEYTGGASNRYRFLNDLSNYRDQTFFVFTNCFGCLETFTATGQTEIEKTGDFEFGNIENRYRKISQDFIVEKTMYSGYLSEDEMLWLDDIVNSYVVSLYNPGTGVKEEITLTGLDKTESTANELQAFNFVYRRAKNNHFVTSSQRQRIFDFTFDSNFE